MPLRVGQPADFFRRLHDQFWVSKFVHEFHVRSPELSNSLLLHVFQTVAANLFDRRFAFSQHLQGMHLVESLFFADFAHGEANVDEHPITGLGLILLQQSQVHFSSHAHHINQRGVRSVGSNLYNLPRYCQAHSASSRRFQFFVPMIHVKSRRAQESFFAMISNASLSSSLTLRAPTATETSLILKSDCLIENSP